MDRMDFARSAVSVPNITLRLSKTPAGRPPASSPIVRKAGEYLMKPARYSLRDNRVPQFTEDYVHRVAVAPVPEDRCSHDGLTPSWVSSAALIIREAFSFLRLSSHSCQATPILRIIQIAASNAVRFGSKWKNAATAPVNAPASAKWTMTLLL